MIGWAVTGAGTASSTVLAAVLLIGCQAPLPSELERLAEQPPLPYSVLVTGGAFVTGPADADPEAPLASTFRGAVGDGEAVGLDDFVESLRAARAFVQIDVDARTVVERRELAALGRAPLPQSGDAIRDVLDAARRAGHDYLLVVQRLEDGPVEELGVNDRWPLSGLLWILVGFGIVIPDHSYESRAALHAAMRDAHTGRMVWETVLSGGVVELSLIDRASAWGFIASILVPPFLLGSDDERVVDEVRQTASDRLRFLLAREVKSIACRQRLVAEAPASFAFVRDAEGDGAELRITSAEALSDVRLRRDGRALRGTAATAFQRELIGSESFEADGSGKPYRYTFRFEAAGRGRLQVLVQSVAGRVGSVTFDLAEF